MDGYGKEYLYNIWPDGSWCGMIAAIDRLSFFIYMHQSTTVAAIE